VTVVFWAVLIFCCVFGSWFEYQEMKVVTTYLLLVLDVALIVCVIIVRHYLKNYLQLLPNEKLIYAHVAFFTLYVATTLSHVILFQEWWEESLRLLEAEHLEDQEALAELFRGGPMRFGVLCIEIVTLNC